MSCLDRPTNHSIDSTIRFGWFWECPNGGEKCQYRHALLPGFVLKSQRKAAEEAAKANTISLEEFLEVEVGECLSVHIPGGAVSGQPAEPAVE